jgi:CDP-glucose 4,6-dehydratase
MRIDPGFWAGKRVLLTGHTGFKGAWTALWLLSLGAHVRGYADGVPTQPALFDLTGLDREIESVTADIADAGALAAAARGVDVALHLAAQAFVRRSLREPLATWQTNVLGTCAFLEATRAAEVPCAVVVTSDKCYGEAPTQPSRGFVESDPMGGRDPYSSSKGAAELAVEAWRRSFGVRVASARAGNAIGGGDWGEDRLVADVMRAAQSGATIAIRNPDAVRPWQHVLEPLSGYLALAQALYADGAFARAFNFGPGAGDARPVRFVVARLAELWPDPLAWDLDEGDHPAENPQLVLDATHARERLGWTPTWDLDTALGATVDWHVAHRDGEDLRAITLRQIERHQAARVTA